MSFKLITRGALIWYWHDVMYWTELKYLERDNDCSLLVWRYRVFHSIWRCNFSIWLSYCSTCFFTTMILDDQSCKILGINKLFSSDLSNLYTINNLYISNLYTINNLYISNLFLNVSLKWSKVWHLIIILRKFYIFIYFIHRWHGAVSHNHIYFIFTN